MKTYPVKHKVKVITITKQNQKINFQIRHPENTTEIIGIAVTCDLQREKIDDPTLPNKGETAGYLTLSIPQKGDTVYSEDVKFDENIFSDIPERFIYGVREGINWAGKRLLYFETCYKVDKAILEGFYEDIYSPESTPPDGTVKPYLYRIRVYIRYKAQEEMTKTVTP